MTLYQSFFVFFFFWVDNHERHFIAKQEKIPSFFVIAQIQHELITLYKTLLSKFEVSFIPIALNTHIKHNMKIS